MNALANTSKSSELQAYSQRMKHYIESSQAQNTRRAYRSSFQHFCDWAATHDQDCLPASANTVMAYLVDLAENGYKASTLELRIAAIKKAHEAKGLDSPTSALAVRQLFKGIRNEIGTAANKKKPLTTDQIRAWINTLDDGLKSKRDKALILLGFAGAFRRSELVGIDVEHLDFTPQGVIVRLPKSKTDQEGEGRIVAIKDHVIFPVRALQDWLKASKITSGPVFRPLTPPRSKGGTQIRRELRLSDRYISVLVKDLCQSIGLDASNYAAHSLRSGHITEAYQNGARRLTIKQQTGHKSDKALEGYIQIQDSFKENSSSFLG